MPLTAQFINSEAYYAVLSHELVHWTGHPKRLNRTDKPERSKRENYAFEELVAELGSAFLMGYLGYQSRITDQAEYIAHWLEVMQNDKKFVIQAASQAQAAVDFILQTQTEQANKSEQAA